MPAITDRTKAINLRLDCEVIRLLRERFGDTKRHGRYLSRLVREDLARCEARDEVLRAYGLTPKDQGDFDEMLVT